VVSGAGGALTVVLQTATGDKTAQCNRIIARLGAIPPRKFVESIGIKFPNERADAIPELSRHYESNVAGVYVIGSLAGYPLIKQAMNQGYDVVEFINGNDLKPADHPLLEYQFHGLPFERPVEEMVERFQTLIPMFRQMNGLQFRELIIESDVIVAYPEGAEHKDAQRKMEELGKRLAAKDPQPRATRIVREGEAIYSPGEFGTSFFTIVDGEVTLEGAQPPHIRTRLGRGEFFGEMSLLSGRPRSDKAIAGPGCILVETPRRTMVKLMNSNEEVRSGIDWIFVVRELQRHFAPFATLKDLRGIAARVTLRRFKAGEVLFKEGEVGDSLFVLRSGGVALSRKKGAEQILVAEVRSGHLVGEMALMGDPVRRETATTTVAADAIEIKRKEFLELARREDARLDPLQKDVSRRVIDNARMQVRPEAGSLMNFLMREGLGEATNVLLIDESLCVGCDNCEKACAETHGGVSRLDREAGATYANVHIPTACRHCEQPHCMKDCPPNAIRRSESGEVYINDSCIGCGNCQANCPYDVIRMVYDAPKKPGLLSWLLFGGKGGPGEQAGYEPNAAAKEKGKKAVKCDACVGIDGGPACVRSCPTGAAIRIGPEQFVDLVEERKR
jgi:Fe-S-cluster-containing hydrogenase component 2